MSSDIDCIFQGLGDRGAIYISSYKAAKNLQLLESFNIRAVLSAARGGKIDYKKTRVSHYMYLTIDDNQSYDISQHFESTYNFIENARKQTNVLIHCAVGISRSVTLAIAYLIQKYKYSLPQIFALLKRKRPKISPNPNFIKLLQEQSKKYSISNHVELQFNNKKNYGHKRSHSEAKVKNQQKIHQKFNFLQNDTTSKKVNQIYSKKKQNKNEEELKAVLQKRMAIQQKIKSFRQSFLSKEKKQKNISPHKELTPKYEIYSLKSFPSKDIKPIIYQNQEVIEQSKQSLFRLKEMETKWLKFKGAQDKSKLMRKCSNPQNGQALRQINQSIINFKKQSVSSNATNDSSCIS